MPFDDPRELANGYLAAARNPQPEVTYGPMGERYEVEQYRPPTVMGMDPMGVLSQFMFRGRMPQTTGPRGPWSPPAAPPARTQQAPVSAQGMYEALLGRPPGGGPGSGSPWKSPLFWAAQAGNLYGNWKLWGGDERLEDARYRYNHGRFPEDDPNNSRYDRERWERIGRYEGESAQREAEAADREIARRLGLETNWSGPRSVFGQHPEPDDRKRAEAVVNYRTRGGVGNAPY